ncbi:alpha/beta fold hydrolase [Nonomuraea sp. GTA35]|uniref:alpha/beta fold hydrolase n=1 Tax=Nonomuraea sp. GTA35 TaxID=1676746 RepID=UPI0035BFB857
MDFVTSQDGTRLAFDRYGDGPPLIYVGGALNDRRSGVAVAEPLSSRFTLYYYDRRGRGDSGDTQPFAVEREIEDLAALISAAGGQAAVFGISSGGALSLRAAAALGPGVIPRLAVYEVPFTDGSREALQERATYAADLAALLAEGRHGDAVARFMKLVGTPEDVIAQMRTAPFWPTLEPFGPSLAYDSEAVHAFAGGAIPMEVIKAVEIPVLVMDGGASPPMLRDPARALAAALPDAHHETLPGQTHDVAPEPLARSLAAFL